MPQVNLAKIKKIMHQKGITQPMLAKMLKVHKSSIYRKLSKRTKFTGNQVGQLSEILGVSVAVLYGLHEDKPQGGIF